MKKKAKESNNISKSTDGIIGVPLKKAPVEINVQRRKVFSYRAMTRFP